MLHSHLRPAHVWQNLGWLLQDEYLFSQTGSPGCAMYTHYAKIKAINHPDHKIPLL